MASLSSSFHSEIRSMMYSLGDVRHPSPESAALVEEITKTQMENILLQAIKVVHMRGSHVINVEDILFLLRKDKCKLRRLLKHLHLKESLKAATSSKSTESEEMEEDDGFLPQTKKRKVSISFLGPLDSGHSSLLESYKEEEEERLQKQDALTSNMDSEEYVDYTECRRVSFYRKIGKFKEWLKISSYNELKPTQEVMEVLCFLAYDTVREIMEMSLLVKNDMESLYLDPSSSHSGHLPLPLSTADRLNRLSSSASDEATGGSLSGSANSPLTSVTPNSPRADTYTTATTRSMQGGRKRNRNASTSQEAASTAVTIGSNVHSSTTVDSTKPTRAIQPVHIREAMRRYSNLTGPLSPLASHFSRPTTNQRTLCL